MKRTIIFAGDVSIIKKYKKLLTNDGVKIDNVDNNNTLLRYQTLDGKMWINIKKKALFGYFQIVNCNKISENNIIEYIYEVIEWCLEDGGVTMAIHPTLSHVIIDDHFIRCIPFEQLRNIIERPDTYDNYWHVEEHIKEQIQIDDAYYLSDFTLENPSITTCCQEDEIEYPEFIKIRSSDDIADWMDSIMIDDTFIQTGDWINVTTIMYNGTKSTWENVKNGGFDHICGIDFGDINTLYISGLVGCNSKCKVACPNIIFINQTTNVQDFCKLNASIVRFDHECYAPNSEELIESVLSLIKEFRSRKHTFDPDTVQVLKDKHIKNKTSRKFKRSSSKNKR